MIYYKYHAYEAVSSTVSAFREWPPAQGHADPKDAVPGAPLDSLRSHCVITAAFGKHILGASVCIFLSCSMLST